MGEFLAGEIIWCNQTVGHACRHRHICMRRIHALHTLFSSFDCDFFFWFKVAERLYGPKKKAWERIRKFYMHINSCVQTDKLRIDFNVILNRN